MTDIDFNDPRGEYKRICPYCKEGFTATHMNRFYCESKNGIKNFCKNRQKRLVKELSHKGFVVPSYVRPPIKVIFEKPENAFTNIDETIENSIILRNVRILDEMYNEKSSNLFLLDDLESEGMELNVRTRIEEISDGTKNPIYGPYRLVPISEKEVIITIVKK